MPSDFRVVSMPYDFDHPAVEAIGFRSTRSLLDGEIVIWDPAQVADEYQATDYRGRPSLTTGESTRFQQDLARRKAELAEFMKLGRVIVVPVHGPQVVWVDTGRRTYSGTGRSRVTTRIVEDVDVLSALPWSPPNAIPAEGHNISGLSEPARRFLGQVADFVSYFAYFEDEVGVPLFRLKGTSKAVGCAIKHDDGGVLLFAPDFDGSRLVDASGDIGDSEVAKASRSYIDALLELISSVRTKEELDLPPWAQDVVLPEEAKLREQLRTVDERLRATLEERDKGEAALATVERKKLLFTGTGDSLVDEVQRAFEALGCRIEPPQPGRDDLIIHHGDRPAVVEVKGTGKSAAEAHAAQLEKWVSSYLERTGNPAKGILVVNGFRETPLSKRSAVFPNQMHDYCVRRQHALITGAQLLAATLRVESGQETSQQLLDRLFSTDGPVTGLDLADVLAEPLDEVTKTKSEPRRRSKRRSQ